MSHNDHLSNEVSIEGQITETGLSAKAKSRAIAAVDRFIGSLIDIPASQMQLLVNKKYVVQRAVEYLTSPNSGMDSELESDAAEVDPDWLDYFGGYAEKANSEKVRDLWARVLAGEIRHPGSFSRSTLRLLTELDQKMASWFEKETESRIMGKYILRPDDHYGERLERLVFLEQVGLLYHVSPIGSIRHTFKPDSDGWAAVVEGNLCLRMHIDHEVVLDVIPITRVGKEIAAILPPVDPNSVFKRLANALPDEVKSIDICQILEKHKDQVQVSDPIKVLRPGTADSS